MGLTCDYRAVMFTYSHYEVPLIQEVSDINTSPFLDTDEIKVALRAQKFPGLWRNGPMPCN